MAEAPSNNTDADLTEKTLTQLVRPCKDWKEQCKERVFAQTNDSRTDRILRFLAWPTPQFPVITWLMLISMVLLSEQIFRLVGQDYFRWYMRNGAAVFLGVGLVSLVWNGLDLSLDLISPNPLKYVRGLAVLFAGTAGAVAAILVRNRPTRRIEVLEYYSSCCLLVLMSLGVLVWVVIIAPMQFILHVFTGSVARTMLKSDMALWYDWQPKRVQMYMLPKTVGAVLGGTEAGVFAKPISLTSVFDAALLWVASQFLG